MSLDRQQVIDALPAYEVGGELGRGGWGVVLEGRHRQLDRGVAIKQLPRAFASNPDVRTRFTAEARVLASLDHPHIVPVFDYVEQDGVCLLVMEKLPGGTVWTRFTTSGVTMDVACSIVLATCAALQCAHGRGILHRDIKPENLMFSGAGTLKLTDFGIAKVIGGAETLATRTGEVLGTPAYMAPEQAQAASLSPATDIYAVGTMLYELLAGELPFVDDGDALRLLYAHAYEQPRPLLEVAPQVPAPIADVVMHSLVTDPADRYQTAEEFGVALAEATTEAWGAGWLGRTDMAVMAASAIVAVTERASAAPRPATQVRVGAGSATALADPPEVMTSPAPATVARPVAPVPQPMRPSVTVRAVHAPPVDLEDADLVPVREVIARPAPPTAPLAVAIGAVLLSVAIAFIGLGSTSHGGSIAPGAITVAGADPAASRAVSLDLTKPIPIIGIVPAGAAVDSVRVEFRGGKIPLGSAGGPAKAAPGGRFTASVDAGGSRYLVAGQSTATVLLRHGSQVVGTRSFAVRSRQSSLLTAPMAVTAAFVLFVLAYAESLLRSLRRGRRRVTGPPGMVVVGALFGITSVAVAWLSSAREPDSTTIAVCGIVGAVGGLAAAMSALRIARRRRRPRRS